MFPSSRPAASRSRGACQRTQGHSQYLLACYCSAFEAPPTPRLCTSKKNAIHQHALKLFVNDCNYCPLPLRQQEVKSERSGVSWRVVKLNVPANAPCCLSCTSRRCPSARLASLARLAGKVRVSVRSSVIVDVPPPVARATNPSRNTHQTTHTTHQTITVPRLRPAACTCLLAC